MGSSALLEQPNVAASVARLMSGEVFVALANDTPVQRAAELEAVLAKVVDGATRVVWVGNPLRSPLTMERFLLQIVGPEIDLRVERGPADLARLFARRVEQESRLLVVVQQPETIDPQTADALTAMSGHLGGEAVQVQFLLVGTSALRVPAIVRPEIGPMIIGASRAVPVPDGSAEHERGRPRRAGSLPLILLLAIVTAGVAVSLVRPDPKAPAREVSEAPAVAPTAAESIVRLDPGDVELLRRRFESFLAERASSLPPLTATQKDTLFTEFLTHHRRE